MVDMRFTMQVARRLCLTVKVASLQAFGIAFESE